MGSEALLCQRLLLGQLQAHSDTLSDRQRRVSWVPGRCRRLEWSQSATGWKLACVTQRRKQAEGVQLFGRDIVGHIHSIESDG